MDARAFAVAGGDPASLVRRAIAECGLVLGEEKVYDEAGWAAASRALRALADGEPRSASELANYGSPPDPRTLVWTAIDLHLSRRRAILIWFDREVARYSGAPWELALVRRLSTLSGGLAAAVQEDRSTGQYGVAAFLAGRTVALRTTDELLASAPFVMDIGDVPVEHHFDAFPYFERLFGEAAELTPASAFGGFYEPHPVHHLTYTGGAEADPRRLDMRTERPLARIGASNVEEADLRAALGDLRSAAAEPDQWRWRHIDAGDESAAVPYLLLQREGPGDPALLEAVSRRLSPIGLAGIELPGRGGNLVETTTASIGRPVIHSTGRGTSLIMAALREIGMGVMEPASLLWPAEDPGTPL